MNFSLMETDDNDLCYWTVIIVNVAWIFRLKRKSINTRRMLQPADDQLTPVVDDRGDLGDGKMQRFDAFFIH